MNYFQSQRRCTELPIDSTTLTPSGCCLPSQSITHIIGYEGNDLLCAEKLHYIFLKCSETPECWQLYLAFCDSRAHVMEIRKSVLRRVWDCNTIGKVPMQLRIVKL